MVETRAARELASVDGEDDAGQVMARRSPSGSVVYLDGPRLRRGLLAGCENVRHFQAELNRINVFPVPDGDAGTNLSMTAQAIADDIGDSRTRRVDVLAAEAAQASILGARGNCGMLMAHFLIRFRERPRGPGAGDDGRLCPSPGRGRANDGKRYRQPR